MEAEILALFGWAIAAILGWLAWDGRRRAHALELELLELRARSTELDEKLQVAVQERDGAMRRARAEGERLKKFGQEGLLKGLLPVLDNLELALGAAAEGRGLKQGVSMVASQMIHELARHGMEVFESEGAEFDPRLHEAIDKEIRDDLEPGTVIRQGRRGVMLHDRLLRPAQVVVAAAPPVQEAEVVERPALGDADEAEDATDEVAADAPPAPSAPSATPGGARPAPEAPARDEADVPPAADDPGDAGPARVFAMPGPVAAPPAEE